MGGSNPLPVKRIWAEEKGFPFKGFWGQEILGGGKQNLPLGLGGFRDFQGRGLQKGLGEGRFTHLGGEKGIGFILG